MKFELQTLDSYEDDDLVEELKRVSDLVNGRLTMSKFDEHSKVHSSTVRNRFNGWGNALEKAGLGDEVSPQARTITDKQIVALAKDIAQKLNTVFLTNKQFTQHTGIGQKTILNRFGSWKEVLKRAELETVALGRRYSDEECFENILNLWMHYGRQPNYAELKQPPSNVGAKAYIGRWGSWRKALRAFVENASNTDKANQETEVNKPSELKEEYEGTPKQAKSRSLSLGIRYKILVRDNFRCVICGRSPAINLGTILHIDHILAWSKGGSNDPSNLRVLCSDCNFGKGDNHEIA
ncbi:HNH endonuclease [Methylobacter sp. Wu1]|jgi:hypothetical protein|uniref:homing endonuclease associated repeat-containing protein n=1 Tax=Methylobacter sp. Wu1 TaxID=3119359 RepID=UPI002F933CD9